MNLEVREKGRGRMRTSVGASQMAHPVKKEFSAFIMKFDLSTELKEVRESCRHAEAGRGNRQSRGPRINHAWHI